MKYLFATFSLFFMLVFSACTWVKPVEEAKEIALVKPELAQHCKKISVVTVKVADSVGFINRKDGKVQDELITMQALNKEGNSVGAKITVVATGMMPGLGEPIFDRLDADIAHDLSVQMY